jgi:hypothetical protein
MVFAQKITTEWSCAFRLKTSKRKLGAKLALLVRNTMARRYEQRVRVLCFRLLSEGFSTHVRIWKKTNAARNARRFLSDFAPKKGKSGDSSYTVIIFRLQIAKFKATIDRLRRFFTAFVKVTQVQDK